MLAVLTEGDGRGGGCVQETASSLSQLSTQTVFSMLSHLTQWSRHILYSKPRVNGKTCPSSCFLICVICWRLLAVSVLTPSEAVIHSVLLQRVEIISVWMPS